MSRRKNFGFLTKKFQSRQNSTIWNLVFTLPDIVEAMNTLIKERHNHSENCTSAEEFPRTQNLENYRAIEGSGLAFFSTDLGHSFASNVGIEFGVMLRGKEPHKPEFAYDIVRKRSLMIYIELIDYKIVGDTKPPLLRCFLFISKLNAGDNITTGQYVNYQTFSKLQFRPLLKNFFHSTHFDLRDMSGQKIPFVFVGITRLVLKFRKASNIHF